MQSILCFLYIISPQIVILYSPGHKERKLEKVYSGLFRIRGGTIFVKFVSSPHPRLEIFDEK